MVPFDISRDYQPDITSYPVSRGTILLWRTYGHQDTYHDSNQGWTMSLNERRAVAATAIIRSLECQAGTDTLPATAALVRILDGVYKQTGYKFHFLKQGRHRAVFDIIAQPGGEYLDLVLKLGNKQSNAREVALSFVYPEDWAHIYGAFDYGVIAARVDTIDKISDPIIQTPAFQARADELNKRYVDVSYSDIGYIGDKMVLIGSSIRVQHKDASGQRHAV